MLRRAFLCSIVLLAPMPMPGTVAIASTQPRHATYALAPPRALAPSVRADGGRYRSRVFAQVIVRRDIPYARVTDHTGVETTLNLDVYAPRHDSVRRRAAIVWLHPGGFTQGSKSGEVRWEHDFAQRGYVSIAIDYRLRPTMQWFDMEQRRDAARDAYDDAANSIRWIRRNASRYGVDPARIFVAGYSAGAIVAQDVAAPPGGSRSLVVGAMSIAGYASGPFGAGQAPRLVFHGTRDFLVPYERDKAACSLSRALGNRCELVTIENGEHDVGFVKFTYIADRTARFFASIANSD